MIEISQTDGIYFPILRGRLNELLAIRELVESKKLNRRIIPIIEPVNLSPTLLSTIETFAKEDIPLGIIKNPLMGTFIKELKEASERNLINEYDALLKQSDKFIDFYYLNDFCSEKDFIEKEYKVGVIINNLDSISKFDSFFRDKKPILTFIPDETSYRRKIKGNRVLWADRFNKQERNSDYLLAEDELFSEDHLYFQDEGYAGFSDYSVIGKDYSENGFAPYAIALHIVYMQNSASKEPTLRIRHFVSDSNFDISNLPEKFEEAAKKLCEWNEYQKLNTDAIQELIRFYQRKSFPGLGYIKRLSIKHHFEVMGDYFKGHYENR